MVEDVQLTLEIAGITLTFDKGEILGIPGFSIETFASLDNGYEIERQSFSFQISTLDCADSEIQKDDSFTIEDLTYIYTFKVDKTPMPDLTGFTRLQANFVSKELL